MEEGQAGVEELTDYSCGNERWHHKKVGSPFFRIKAELQNRSHSTLLHSAALYLWPGGIVTVIAMLQSIQPFVLN